MRSRAALAAGAAALAGLAGGAAALAGCASTDVARPIGLVSDGLTAQDAAELAEAARCWNLRFGAQLVTGPEARALEQQVEVFYDDFTCTHTDAQYQPGIPGAIAVCPERYRDPDRYGLGFPITPFRLLSHEIGHALNIVGHPSKHGISPETGSPVMLAGGLDFVDMFKPVDVEMFAGANPGFTPAPACPQVTRLAIPGISGPIGRCACNEGELDISRSIAIVPYPGAAEFPRQALTAAAGCWNLRYGTRIEVPQAPELPDPELQVAYIAQPGSDCPAFEDLPGRILDGRAVTVCSQHVSLQDIGTILGLPYHGGLGEAPFRDETDAAFAEVYPGHPIACRDLRMDQQTGACACMDRPSVHIDER